MKISKCSQCPFCVAELDFDCLGMDTLEYCNLARVRNMESSVLRAYDQHQRRKPKEVIPEWCPLRGESVTVELNGV